MTKNIVLITYGNFPYGGASANLLRYFAMGLTHVGNTVKVILPTGNYYGQKVDHNKTREGVLECGVEYRHLGYVNHPRKVFGKLLDNILGVILPFIYLLKKKTRKETDLIVIYNIEFLNFLMILFAKLINKKKLVVMLPEFYEKPNTTFFSVKTFKWYSFYFSMKCLLKYADGFIVLSHYLKNFVDERTNGQKPVLIMPNLIDPERFNLRGKDVEPFAKGKITIGYVGTPTRKDGVMDLIQSFSILNKKFPETHLLIIGDITNGTTLVPSLKKYASEFGVDKEITFTGLVSHDAVPELLQSCQILALTRPKGVFAEAGFPTKLGEYFACKKPVVITNVGDIPKYFKDEYHVMIAEPENITSIINAFEKILFSTENNKKMVVNAYYWLLKNLLYTKAAERIDLFFENIIRKNYEKNKVIITTPHPDNVGGIANLTELLIQYNNDTNYIKFLRGCIDKNKSKKLHRIFIALFLPFRFIYTLIKNSTFKVVHINVPLSKFCIYRDFGLILLSFVLGRKIVSHFRGGELSQNKNIKFIDKILICFILTLSNKVIVLGEQEKNFYQKFFGSRFENKIYIVPNAVKIPLNKTTKPKNCLNILFLGRIDKNKGLVEIIDALKELPKKLNYKFFIAGDGPEKKWFLEECEKYLEKKFVYYGFVKGENKEKLYNESHIFLLPSYFEGLPNSLLEAMSYGLVPIVTPVGSIKEVVSKENGILVPIHDHYIIKNSIVMLYENHRTRESLSSSAYKTISSKYSIEKYCLMINRVYRETL